MWHPKLIKKGRVDVREHMSEIIKDYESGESSGDINEVDHYPKNFSKILKDNNIKTLEDAKKCEELWSLDNGRVLYLKCHNKTKKGSKSNKL